MLEPGDDAGNARGKVCGKALDVASYRGESDIEKEGEGSEYGDDEGDDRDRAGGRVLSDPEAHDALHDGAEHDGEESADVNQLQDLAKTPGEREAKREGEGKENVASNRGDLVRAVVRGVGVIRLQGQRARSLGL